LRDRGTTVFLNSHFLSEVEITCDRVAFIKHGKVIHSSSLQTLVEGEVSVEIRGHGLTQVIAEGLQKWGSNIRLDGERLHLTLPGELDLPEINRFLVNQGVDVYEIRPARISLEDLFIQIVGVDGGL
jgi:ABC-2 type transport system ATP-binding protein